MKKTLSLLACAALSVALLASPASAEDAQTPLSGPETASEVQTPPEPEIVSESPAPVADPAVPVEEPAAPVQEEATQTDPVADEDVPLVEALVEEGIVQQVPQVVSEWHTWLSPTYTPDATDASGIGWDQTYLGAGQIDPPACSTTVQQDLYVGTREEIDAVLADQILTRYENGTIEDHAIVEDWDIVSSDPCPVVTNACEPGTGDTSTNIAPTWTNVDTRSAGHYEYVDGGLHVWTDDNSSNAKVSLGHAGTFPLHDTGVLGLDWTGSTPPPGINLFVDFGADGTGTLVYESVYGQDLWLTNGSSATVKANAPVNGGGNGSQWHGTIDQWLTVYPDATVTGFAFSLGSGVLGDGVIHSVAVNCATYLFDHQREVPVQPQPRVETETWYESVCVEPLDGSTNVTKYGQDTTYPVAFDLESWTWVEGGGVVGEVYVIEEFTAEDEECAAVVVHTPTPSVTPTVTPTATPSATPTPVAQVHTALASTGSDGVLWMILGAIVLVLLGTAIAVVASKRRQV